MEKTKKQHPEPILTLKLAVLLGVAVAFCLPAIVLATAPFDDDFEAYELGNLSPQSYWNVYTGSDFQVNNTNAKSPTKSIKTLDSGGNYGIVRISDLVESGGWQFSSFEVVGTYPSQRCNADLFFYDGAKSVGSLRYVLAGEVCTIRYYPFQEDFLLGEIDLNYWHDIIFEWDKDTQKVRYKLDTNDYTAWVNPSYDFVSLGGFLGVEGVSILGRSWSNRYFDDFVSSTPPPSELRVFGVSPVSGTTATSTANNLTIGWEGFDFEDIYTDFVFSFYEENTEIIIGSVIYTPTTTAGTYILPFSDFGFDKNGKYYLKAKARSPLYEWTAYYTSDLVSPEWWINFNVSGWEAVFEMPEFESWYASTSKFATSTAIFTGITTFLSPIMNKLGEFGDRVVEFLDLDEAYDRGYDLGKIIPTFRHYVSGIEVFFGGFPIIQIFLAFMVILLGVFVVRLIRG